MNHDAPKVTRKELAEAMLYLAKKGVAQFCGELSEATGIPYSAEDERMAWIVEEARVLHLWVISKTLSPEKDLLDAVHNCYWEYLQSHKMTADALELFKAKVSERYERYYAAWDDKAGGNQWILASEIQKCLFDRGRQTGRLPDAFSGFRIISWVSTFMRIVLKSRSRYEIT